MQTQTSSLTLVTGAAELIASEIIKQLLEQNYIVRGTVRSLAKEEKYSFLYDIVPEKKGNLKFIEANLKILHVGWQQ